MAGKRRQSFYAEVNTYLKAVCGILAAENTQLIPPDPNVSVEMSGDGPGSVELTIYFKNGEDYLTLSWNAPCYLHLICAGSRHGLTANDCKIVLEPILDTHPRISKRMWGGGETAMFELKEAYSTKRMEELVKTPPQECAAQLREEIGVFEQAREKIAQIGAYIQKKRTMGYSYIPLKYMPFNDFCQAMQKRLANGLLNGLAEPPKISKCYQRDKEDDTLTYNFHLESDIFDFTITYADEILAFTFSGDCYRLP